MGPSLGPRPMAWIRTRTATIIMSPNPKQKKLRRKPWATRTRRLLIPNPLRTATLSI